MQLIDQVRQLRRHGANVERVLDVFDHKRLFEKRFREFHRHRSGPVGLAAALGPEFRPGPQVMRLGRRRRPPSVQEDRMRGSYRILLVGMRIRVRAAVRFRWNVVVVSRAPRLFFAAARNVERHHDHAVLHDGSAKVAPIDGHGSDGCDKLLGSIVVQIGRSQRQPHLGGRRCRRRRRRVCGVGGSRRRRRRLRQRRRRRRLRL